MDTLECELAKKQAALCRIMGNAYRLQILWSLEEREQTVSELAERVGGSLQNVSQHLSLLKKKNLITSRRQGQHIFYRLIPYPWLTDCLATSRSLRVSKTSLSHVEVLADNK